MSVDLSPSEGPGFWFSSSTEEREEIYAVERCLNK